MTAQQRQERHQTAAAPGLQGAGQRGAGFRLASAFPQQQAQLHIREAGEHQRAAPACLALQLVQLPLGGLVLATPPGQGGAAQAQVQRQLGQQFRGGGRLRAGIGVAQASEPQLGQRQLPLPGPELALHQGDQGQVIDGRHVPGVQGAFAFGEQAEGFGVVAGLLGQGGQHAIADHQGHVATGARLTDPGLQSRTGLLRLQAQRQQITFVEHQAGADRIRLVRTKALQTRQSQPHFFQRAQDFPTRLQHPRAIVMGQRLEQRVAVALRQFQRLAIEVAGAPQHAPCHRQVGQGGDAHEALPEAVGRQGVQGFAAMPLGQRHLAAPAGDHAAERLPLRQQQPLLNRAGRRQEMAQPRGQCLGGIQLTGHGQRPAVQHDQPGREAEQAVGQFQLPAQQHGDVLLAQQLLLGKVLHQFGGDVAAPGAQRLLHGLDRIVLLAVPAAGTQMQAGPGHLAGGRRLAAQQVAEQVVVAEPAALVVQRHQEDLVRLEVFENRGAVRLFAQRIAQLGAEALETGSLVEEGLYRRRLAVDHFLEQVIVDQSVGARRGQWIGIRPGRVLAGQQPQAQAGDPAFATLQQQVAFLVAQLGALPSHQRAGFLGAQAQILHLQFQQLAVQAQPRQVPGGPLATGDQQAHAGRQVVEDELQAVVEHRALRQVVVVQHQQQILARKARLQFVEQAAQPGFEGKGLMRLAHAQQGQTFLVQAGDVSAQPVQQALEETPRVAVAWPQIQPQGAPAGRQVLAEFTGQRALAEAGRRADQQQTAIEPLSQAFAQLRAGCMTGRQGRPVEMPLR